MSQPDEEPTLSPEQEQQARQMAHDMAAAREQLLEADVSTVIANHALGIYELAAIHLTQETPRLDEARLAVDALASLVEGLEGRLGQGEDTLKDALHQARLAFVQRTAQKQAADKAEVDEPTPDEPEPGELPND